LAKSPEVIARFRELGLQWVRLAQKACGGRIVARGKNEPTALIRAGLANVTAEQVVAGSRKMDALRVRITLAGERTLEAATKP
jgi:hypothetical protein